MDNITVLLPAEVSWENYRDLRLRALKDDPQAFGSSYEKEKKETDQTWQNRLESYKRGSSDWMVFAGNKEKLVGMVGAWQSEENRKINTVKIIAMFVASEARGKGISKLLMTSLLELLTTTTSIERVQLDVNSDQIVAVNLYKRMGFTIVEKSNMLLGDGKYHDEYMMEKQLR